MYILAVTIKIIYKYSMWLENLLHKTKKRRISIKYQIIVKNSIARIFPWLRDAYGKTLFSIKDWLWYLIEPF